MMKGKFVEAYMDTAKRFALLSTAVRLQVGSIVVKDDRIISIGYNGTPSGDDNCCENEDEFGNLVTKDSVLHAEANAITKLAKCNESAEGAVIFITHAPCIHCAKLIFQSGIKTVYYDKIYRDQNGVDFLQDHGVEMCYTLGGQAHVGTV